MIAVRKPRPPMTAPTLRALAQSRDGLLDVLRAGAARSHVIAALENDPALLAAALRQANDERGAGTVGSAGRAVDVLGPDALAALAGGVPVVDPLRLVRGDVARVLRFRAHALAVYALARRIAAEVGVEHDDELASAALLHDVGGLALPSRLAADEGTPEERCAAERERFGTDHAELGGWIVRRWRLPERIAIAVEHHHGDRLGLSSVVRLADQLAHVREGRPVDPEPVMTTAMVVGVPASTVDLLLQQPAGALGATTPRPQPLDLSPRELEVLRGVGAGRVPKQVAADLGLAEATVRSHLRRIYQRLGVSDRTQAVLIARERGWLA